MAPPECTIFKYNGMIGSDDLAITTGGRETIQELVKTTAGWDGSSPVATVGIIINNEGEIQPLPTSMTVKQTVAGLMKNVVKPTSKTKHKTWLEVAGAGHWEEIPSNFYWPDPQPENDEETELGMYYKVWC